MMAEPPSPPLRMMAPSGAPMKKKMKQAMEDYRAVDERLLADLGRNPTLEEIAEQLHMTVEGALVVKNMLDNARILASSRKQPEPEEEQEEEKK